MELAVQTQLSHTATKSMDDTKAQLDSDRKALQQVVLAERVRTSQLESEQRAIKDEVEIMQASLAIAERALAPPLGSQSSQVEPRSLDEASLRVSSQNLLAMTDAIKVLEKWLAEANVDKEFYDIRGGDLARNFAVRFKGAGTSEAEEQVRHWIHVETKEFEPSSRLHELTSPRSRSSSAQTSCRVPSQSKRDAKPSSVCFKPNCRVEHSSPSRGREQLPWNGAICAFSNIPFGKRGCCSIGIRSFAPASGSTWQQLRRSLPPEHLSENDPEGNRTSTFHLTDISVTIWNPRALVHTGAKLAKSKFHALRGLLAKNLIVMVQEAHGDKWDIDRIRTLFVEHISYFFRRGHRHSHFCEPQNHYPHRHSGLRQLAGS
jgi:hypothetical protein